MSNLVCGKWKKICLFASCATKLVLGSKTFSITLRTSTVRGTISAKCVQKSSNLETRCQSIATGTTKKAYPLSDGMAKCFRNSLFFQGTWTMWMPAFRKWIKMCTNVSSVARCVVLKGTWWHTSKTHTFLEITVATTVTMSSNLETRWRSIAKETTKKAHPLLGLP